MSSSRFSKSGFTKLRTRNERRSERSLAEGNRDRWRSKAREVEGRGKGAHGGAEGRGRRKHNTTATHIGHDQRRFRAADPNCEGLMDYLVLVMSRRYGRLHRWGPANALGSGSANNNLLMHMMRIKSLFQTNLCMRIMHCFINWCGIKNITRPLQAFSVKVYAVDERQHMHFICGAGVTTAGCLEGGLVSVDCPKLLRRRGGRS